MYEASGGERVDLPFEPPRLTSFLKLLRPLNSPLQELGY